MPSSPYIFERTLGSGSYGQVHQMVHTRSGRQVAVKTLSDQARANGPAVRMFQAEAIAMATVDHPGLIPILDMGTLPPGDIQCAKVVGVETFYEGSVHERSMSNRGDQVDGSGS